jgi:hypothetical protein
VRAFFLVFYVPVWGPGGATFVFGCAKSSASLSRPPFFRLFVAVAVPPPRLLLLIIAFFLEPSVGSGVGPPGPSLAGRSASV